jgi:hypothetical protein
MAVGETIQRNPSAAGIAAVHLTKSLIEALLFKNVITASEAADIFEQASQEAGQNGASLYREAKSIIDQMGDAFKE